MADEPQATGTGAETQQTPKADGTAESAAPGGAAEDKITVSKAAWDQHLREKNNNEEMRRRLKEYEDSLAQQGGTPTPGPSQAEAEAAAFQQVYAELSASSHPADKLLVATIDNQRLQNQRLEYRLDLMEVPPEDRDEVGKLSRQHRIMPSLARKLIEAERLKSKESGITQREKQLEEREKLKAQGVVATHVTSIPTTETNNQTMTGADYAAKVKKLVAEGQTLSARELMRQRESGKLEITD